MPYTSSDLLQDLAAMGLTGQETILVHSSMRSIGAVEGGADTVLDALTTFFADGLLLLPTHTWKTVRADAPVFDVRRSPCCVGILPELFRQRPGVVRSLHPTHSLAGCGKNAADYLAGEELCNTPCTLCDARKIFEVTRYVLAPDPECIVTAPGIPPERWQ